MIDQNTIRAIAGGFAQEMNQALCASEAQNRGASKKEVMGYLNVADMAMQKAWDALDSAGMSNIDISHVRFAVHSAFAKTYGWPSEGAIYVGDRTYPWRHDGVAE